MLVRRVRVAATALAAVIVVGTIGYVLLGFGPLDALYQTVTTVTTVGFREVEPLDSGGKVFTIVLILAGVGTALYTVTVMFESFAEGELGAARGRRRMDRKISDLSDHVVVCGWGRVGQAVAASIARTRPVVVVDRDPARLERIDHLHVVGDATADEVLLEAGVGRAHALVAAINTDAENLYVTLSGRSFRPDLFIIARARDEASVAKLVRAGADRVVNPQAIGGARMAAFVSQPHVSEFLDVVMHERSVELRMEEIPVAHGSSFVGLAVRQVADRAHTRALILAIRESDGQWTTNPSPDAVLTAGSVLIAIGTPADLASIASA